jgi:hypothetical protein
LYITQSNIFIFYYTTLLVTPYTEMTFDLEVNEVEVKVLANLNWDHYLQQQV